ncbi:hypothetical protein K466DRAFT_570757 [Polyporus arcularius HHB13444]|uniref:Uncharacterized protein n=1 Tax=Polyporus arcularius HHB13444 TaxID=1314778 RepID=A0A5C3NQC0_9APHY|nr:hypothetical protein K466DRAFT_570757 [Polyporus arcularius HHB13444]
MHSNEQSYVQDMLTQNAAVENAWWIRARCPLRRTCKPRIPVRVLMWRRRGGCTMTASTAPYGSMNHGSISIHRLVGGSEMGESGCGVPAVIGKEMYRWAWEQCMQMFGSGRGQVEAHTFSCELESKTRAKRRRGYEVGPTQDYSVIGYKTTMRSDFCCGTRGRTRVNKERGRLSIGADEHSKGGRQRRIDVFTWGVGLPAKTLPVFEQSTQILIGKV